MLYEDLNNLTFVDALDDLYNQIDEFIRNDNENVVLSISFTESLVYALNSSYGGNHMTKNHDLINKIWSSCKVVDSSLFIKEEAKDSTDNNNNAISDIMLF